MQHPHTEYTHLALALLLTPIQTSTETSAIMFAVIIFETHMPESMYKAAEANTCEKRSLCSAAVEIAET